MRFESCLRALFAVTMLLAGAAHGGAPDVPEISVVSTMQRVFKDTAITVQATPAIELWAARNEYESAQLALVTDRRVDVRRGTAPPLVHENGSATLAADNFSYGFPVDVYVDWHTRATPPEELDGDAPGWFPDPVEMGGSARIDGVGSLWVRWYVPTDAVPGTYRGTVQIEMVEGVRQVPVTLHVWAFTLPAQPSMHMTNWVYVEEIERQYKVVRGSEKFWRVVEAVADDLAAHRQDVIFTELGLIRTIQRQDGGYDFDFSLYAKWVEIFLKRGFRIFEGSHLNHPKNFDIIKY